LYIAFIYLKAAFDSVDHASLWASLACIGVPSKKLYGVHVVIGSLVRLCKPHALDLTIATTWIRSSS